MHHQNTNILAKVKINFYHKLYRDLPEITVGNKIKKVRLLKNVSQLELANFIKSSRGTIDTFEDDAAYPSPKIIQKISLALNTPIEYFFYDYYKFIFSNFPETLKKWRVKNSLSQRAASKLLNVNPKTLFTWEKGNYMDRINFEKIRKSFKE